MLGVFLSSYFFNIFIHYILLIQIQVNWFIVYITVASASGVRFIYKSNYANL